VILFLLIRRDPCVNGCGFLHIISCESRVGHRWSGTNTS
jgi:hypothetical protein